MNVDPVNEKEECSYTGVVGYSYVMIKIDNCEWHGVLTGRKYHNSQHDSIRLKTNSPKGKRYAY